MSLVQSQISHRDGLISLRSSFFWSFTSSHSFFQRGTALKAPHPPSSPSVGKISPAVLFIIIILAVVFFISGFLHLLIRILKKQRPPSSIFGSNRYPESVVGPEALQRQLQQLFNIHESGLDQAFIDTLPVFHYKDIVGLKEPFDCAICLCEFSEQDKLRLLPSCSHAFHIDCIDTWLQSNSSCPICRAVLYTPGLGIDNPVFDFEDLGDHEDGFGIPCSVGRFGVGGVVHKPGEIEIATEKRVFPVRLGKFKSTSNTNESQGGGKDIGETSSSSLDARRCHSMGSYQYVVTDSTLQVALCPTRLHTDGSDATSELEIPKRTCGQIGNFTTTIGDAEARKITAGYKNESLSVSKIWLWSKKGKFQHSSNTDFSGIPVDMRLPWTNRNQAM